MRLPKIAFFDWDGTLWDFEKNARETIGELLDELQSFPNHRPEFFNTYWKNHNLYWELFEAGKIDLDTLRLGRFADTFSELEKEKGVGFMGKEQVRFLAEEYPRRCPTKNHLFDGTRECLEFFKSHHIPVVILSNGNLKAQKVKIECSGISNLIEHLQTPDVVGGIRKPEKLFFQKALDQFNIRANNALMVGNEFEVDIVPAMEMGFQTIYFNVQTELKPTSPFGCRSIDAISSIPGFFDQ